MVPSGRFWNHLGSQDGSMASILGPFAGANIVKKQRRNKRSEGLNPVPPKGPKMEPTWAPLGSQDGPENRQNALPKTMRT